MRLMNTPLVRTVSQAIATENDFSEYLDDTPPLTETSQTNSIIDYDRIDGIELIE